MRIRTIAAAALALPLIVFSAPPAQAEPAQGGCQQFGKYVSGLAQSLGAEFGGTARSVANSAPRALPEFVVMPLQEAFCGEA